MIIKIIKEFRGPGFITRVGETADSKRSEEPDKAEELISQYSDEFKNFRTGLMEDSSEPNNN